MKNHNDYGIIFLHFYIPQNKDKSIEKNYELFRNKVHKKNNHAWFEKVEEPVQLIINVNEKRKDSQVGVTVKFGSFKPIIGKTKNNEIGFTAVIKLVIFECKLFVYKSGNAHLEMIQKEEK